MESAIAGHLRCPRTQPARAPDDYAPAFAAWTARFDPAVEQLTVAYFGVQCRDAARFGEAYARLKAIAAFFIAPSGPDHHDMTYYQDEAGAHTYVAIAYWNSPETFEAWRNASGAWAWFDADDRLHEEFGYFREILSPRATHVETIFSTPDKFEGASNLAQKISGEFREHGYWGGMRDRLPASQTDMLAPAGALHAVPSLGTRVQIRGHENLAIIRSGQDWSATTGAERELYLGKVRPVLQRGMAFLRDEGLAIGCYVNRPVTLLDERGQPLEKTFAFSAWNSLSDLERWAASHPTHLAIYDTFLGMVHSMNNQLQLRLYHEVMVLKASEQFFEYINCHPKTGLLRAVAAR